MKLSALTVTTAAVALASQAANAAEGSWQNQAITPVSNPIFFETPFIQSEVHPFFMYHDMNPEFLGTDASVKVYAVQIRYAIDDRLALIASKDGYIQIQPKGADHQNGWGNLAAGLKYALFKSEEDQYIVTPGVTVELPTGSTHVYQGEGAGVVNAFVSAEKGWDKLHLTGNVGARLPFNWHDDTSSLHYSGQIDYWFCRWFIPFADINAFTTISNGGKAPFTTEGFDLVNFGATAASGKTQAAAGVGFRSRLHERVDIGFSWEHGITSADDIFKDRYTVDVSIRF